MQMQTDVQLIRLGDQQIGPGQPCFIIAEAGVNHNGSFEMACRLVDVAAEAGVDAVKFQKRNLKKLYPQALLDDPNSAEWAFQYMLPILKQVELEDDEFRALKAYCDQKGIRFMCTPWDEDSLSFLEDVGVDIYKVASADLTNMPLLDAIADTGKPLILSSGMATIPEIEFTVHHLLHRKAEIALLHCVSTYPAPFESLNLRFIEKLHAFHIPIGYSSHERGIVMPVVALTLGACIIEKHVTLDRALPGPDHAASLEPPGLSKMVRDIRNAEIALGIPEKHISTMEKLNQQVLRKSLAAATDIPRGTILTRKLIKVTGPGKGLSPQRLDDLLGVVLDRDINHDEYFTEQDLVASHLGDIPRTKLYRGWGFKSRFHDLADMLAKKPKLVELHFSAEDVDYPFSPPPQPHLQQLFVHAPEFAESKLLDLCSLDDEVRESARHLIQRTIDKAAALAPHFTGPVGVVIHVGGMSMDEPIHNRQRLLQRAVEAMKGLDPKGTILLPENLPPRPWYLGGQWYQNVFIRPEEMIEFCQELGVGMTLDISHAQLYCNYANRSLTDFVAMCLPHTRHLHIADATGIDGEGLQIGSGVVEWDSLVELLALEDFTWVPEIWSGHQNDAAGFIEAIHRLSEFGIF
jgi:N-acetylneuraminate synthase